MSKKDGDSKQIVTKDRPSRLALVVSICIAITLLVAAASKFFYPSPKLKQLDQWVSLFEVGVVLFLLILRKRSWMWLLMACLFAAWAGYALYWFNLKLPCNCLGALIEFPSIFSFSLDILFFLVSLRMASLLGTTRSLLYLTVLLGCLFSLTGYGFAEWVFYRKILDMKKHTISAADCSALCE